MAPRRRSARALVADSTDEEQEHVAGASGERAAAGSGHGVAAPAGPEPHSAPSSEITPTGDSTQGSDDSSSDSDGDGEEGEEEEELVGPLAPPEGTDEEGEDEEEPSYVDDGTDPMEEDEDEDDEEDEDEDEDDEDSDNRRPVSIQEFLAWRMLGRVPDSVRARDDTQRR